MAFKTSDPVFVVRFQKGLADRNRLPLSQVIKALHEIRQMIVDVGHEIQRERGIEEPVSDFGLELLGEQSGIAFKKGSLRAAVAITRDTEIGVLAAQRVLNTVHSLKASTPRKPPAIAGPMEAKIVHRLERVAFINEASRAETHFEIKAPKSFLPETTTKATQSATFGQRAMEAIKSFRAPMFSEDNVTLYGKLFQLKDQSSSDELSGMFFWGELRRDNGERWRIRFKNDEQDRIVELFRRQVMVTGTAAYYQTKAPRLTDVSIDADLERDYEAAYWEMVGTQRTDLPLRQVLDLRYGED